MPFGDNVGPNREIKVVSLIPVLIFGSRLRQIRLEKFQEGKKKKGRQTQC